MTLLVRLPMKQLNNVDMTNIYYIFCPQTHLIQYIIDHYIVLKTWHLFIVLILPVRF